MQHKQLFAALLCGALCLTGCLKNEESASVTQVRNAKANELNARATLMNAQATAETVLANANAELIKAQAKVQEALANKTQAEAEYQAALTKIKEIEAKIKDIEFQAAQEELKLLKAEIEARMKQLEVIIAQANKDLKEVERQLQAIEAQMQVDAIQQEINLLTAEKAYNDLLAELEEEERAHIAEVAFNYFSLQRAILELSIQIFENEIEIEELEAGIVDPAEALAEEIAKAERELARMEYIKETAEAYLEYTEEDWKDAKAIVTGELIKAQNDYLAAYQEYYNFYMTEYAPAQAAIEDTYYKYDYEDSFADWWYEPFGIADYLHNLGAVEHSAYDEDGNLFWQWGYYNDEGEWVELYNEQYSFTGEMPVFYTPEQEEAEEMIEKGIYLPEDTYYMWKYTYVPGETNLENMNAFLDLQVAAAQEEHDALVAEAEDYAENTVKPGIEYNLNWAKGRKTQMEAYVAKVESEFKKVDDALAAAEKKVNDASDAYWAAYDAWVLSKINDAEYEHRLYDYNEALKVQTAAQEAATKAAADVTAAENAKKNLDSQFLAAYGGADKAEAEFNRDLAIAEATANVNAKKAAVTDAIVKAKTDADAAVTAAENAVAAAKKTVEAKLAIWRAAKIALAANPDDAALIEAEGKAAIALAEAEAAVTTAESNLATAKTNQATAKAAYDAVNNPYQAALKTLKNLQDKKAKWEKDLAAAAKKVEDAKAAKSKADADLKAAQDAVKAAKAAMDAVDPDSATAEAKAYKAADKAYSEAFDAYLKAADAVEALEDIHPDYRYYKEELDPENEYGILAEIAYFEEQLEELPAYYGLYYEPLAEYIAGLDEDLQYVIDDIEDVKEYVAQYEEQYRPAYVEAIEAYNELQDEYIELYFAVLAAQEWVEYLEGINDMIGACTFVDENGNIVSVEEYIANIEEEEQELIDAINAKWELIWRGNIDATEEIARLELENQQMNDMITILSVLMQQYEDELNAWLAANAE